MPVRRLSWLLLVATLWAGTAFAQSEPYGVVVGGAWSRATAPSASTAVVYLEMTAHITADRLVAVTTPVAERVELHDTTVDDQGVMQMRAVEALEIPLDGTVTLAPGGLHLMLFGLRHQLNEGDRFPIELRFEQTGVLTPEVIVLAPGAPGPTP